MALKRPHYVPAIDEDTVYIRKYKPAETPVREYSPEELNNINKLIQSDNLSTADAIKELNLENDSIS